MFDTPVDSNCTHYIVLPSIPDEEEIISSSEELILEDPDLSRSQLIRLHRLKTGQLDANLHDFSFEDNVSREEEEKFYQDIIQGQIFLAMATLFHQPKLVRMSLFFPPFLTYIDIIMQLLTTIANQ